MSEIQNAVAARQGAQVAQSDSIAGFLDRLKPEIARSLPEHLNADRMARLALTEVRKTPKLGNCTPESFAGALLTAAALGLEPGVGGEAYLVPHGRECTLIIGYAGMAKLFYQSPLAKNLDSQAVHEHDDFDYAYGTAPFLRHKPARGDRGEVIAYYAVASLNTGASAFVVLSPEEVKALRGGKVGSSGNVPDPQHWMARKTTIRQLVKLLPKSSTLTRAMDSDEKSGTQLRRELDTPTPQLEQGTHVDQVTGEVTDEPEQAFTTEPPAQDAPEQPWT